VVAAVVFGSFTAAADTPAVAPVDGAVTAPVVLARKGLPPVGTVITTKCATQMPAATITGGGPELARISQDMVEEQVCTILGPDRLRVVTTSGGGHFSIRKLPDGEPREEALPSYPLMDLPVVFERREDGRWLPALEGGGKLSEEQRKIAGRLNVAELLESGEAIYGLAPRAVGDRWTVDPGKLPAYAGLLHPKGTLTADLVKVTEVSGEPCAEIHFVYDLESGDEKGPEGKGHSKGEAVVHRSLQDLLDLEERYDGVNRMTDGEVEMAGKSHSETHTTVKRP
jgi:hypothetical protein